jgi:hypothetical protein
VVVAHIEPRLDLVSHDTGSEQPDCVCGPRLVPITDDQDVVGLLIVHQALDGRA